MSSWKEPKRKHALKYQSVLARDGLIIHLSGPFPGTRHDAFIFKQSGLLDMAEAYLSYGEKHFVIYGDPAYAQNNHIVAPFKGVVLSDDEKEFNKRMSSVRVIVEWGFGKIARYWAFVDFHKNQKLLLQRVGKMYTVGGLLTNVHTCCYGSQTPKYFKLDLQALSSIYTVDSYKYRQQSKSIVICLTSQPT
ncbi:hypothetical protein L914_13729 [Phytophthora nicotianae]|uniref:DDE Tnp4 domain-containing protein n=1 Tax=Phytophthora nicotianae TaxID=4792 RepID=W2MVF9_PHYNI|nr:hypothetical protein L914_13729 [Phytophthora nicotianae]